MTERVVTEIWIYPIKSLGGIRLQSSNVREKGLELDRRWMLINNKGMFLTQRNIHTLAEFKVSIVGDSLRITYRGNETHFKSHEVGASIQQAIIWNSLVDVHEVSPLISQWFSEMLQLECRLVHFPEPYIRKVEDPFLQNVSLADAYPILTIGQNSLNDLNARLESPIPMNRFRPNLVFSGGNPYEEDDWKNFSIGEGRLLGSRKSYRCIVTTIDQETGIKGREPLLTLSKYRREHDKIFFGLNTLCLNNFTVSVGDRIILDSDADLHI
jgi:uncharacterized protein